MKNTPNNARTITVAEVKQWFGKTSKAQLRELQYREIAVRLTKFHWPGDPPSPPDSPWIPRIISEADDRYWDFRAAINAAKILRDSIPKMLAFQESLQWAPETRDGYEAIKAFAEALTIAFPFIEWPFGYYKPQTGRKEPKEWHTYAMLVANLIIREMVKAGHPKPGITRNSVVVRVVQKALIKMRIPYAQTVSSTAIGAFLTRWNEKYGLALKEPHFDHKGG